jgi:hypothetical protein
MTPWAENLVSNSQIKVYIAFAKTPTKPHNYIKNENIN